MTRSVLLVIGAGVRFGQGHFVRMRELRDRLQASGLSVDWLTVADFDDATATRLVGQRRKHDRGPVLYVLDARDLYPGPFAHPDARVLALDNRHASRAGSSNHVGSDRAKNDAGGSIEYYDTIPHPRADLAKTLQQVLLRSDVLDVSAGSRGKSGAIRSPGASRLPESSRSSRSLFVYSGNFFVSGLDESLMELARSGWSVHRCGSAPPRWGRLHAGCRWNSKLARPEFMRALAAADCVWTYFGMTLLEAWHLGCRPALLPVESAIHIELAEYLSREAGLPIISPVGGNVAAAFESAAVTATLSVDSKAAPHAKLRPGDGGFDLLIEKIQALVARP